MSFEDLVAADPSGTTFSVEYYEDEGASTALLFMIDQVDPEWDEEIEIWLETAEDVEADEDLVIIGIHPVGDDTQVDHLLYRRVSEGDDSAIYALDIDGTAVPGSLQKWADGFGAFTRTDA